MNRQKRRASKASRICKGIPLAAAATPKKGYRVRMHLRALCSKAVVAGAAQAAVLPVVALRAVVLRAAVVRVAVAEAVAVVPPAALLRNSNS